MRIRAPGCALDLAGAGILAGSPQKDAASKAIDFLLSEEGQRYFADETAETRKLYGELRNLLKG